jgi:protein-tyrosine phosphatase
MRALNRSVLVHCAAGVSRSTTVVVNYIMNTYQKTPMDAFLLVKERRAVARPNTGFMRELGTSSRATEGRER